MKLCTEPWSTVTIDYNGDIKPCLCADWNTVGAIGNILDKDLIEILDSEKLQLFKSQISSGNYSSCTEICPVKDHITDKDPSVIDNLTVPNKILLSVDLNCNLACESCRTHNIFSSKINNDALTILNKIYDFYYDKQVELQFDGAGDLFASKAYQHFLQKKFNDNFRFHIITNGNLLKKQKKIVENIKNNIISIDVSIDASNAETYKKTRGGVFQLVREGIEMCVSMGIKVNLSFVVQAKNYKELKTFWDLAVELKCHSVMFHLVRRWWHMDDTWWGKNSIEHLPKTERTILFNQLSFLKKVEKHVTPDSVRVNMTGDLYNFKP
jgi:radical SAM protein with 4Fe4S-binding SPASM domain